MTTGPRRSAAALTVAERTATVLQLSASGALLCELAAGRPVTWALLALTFAAALTAAGARRARTPVAAAVSG